VCLKPLCSAFNLKKKNILKKAEAPTEVLGINPASDQAKVAQKRFILKKLSV